MIRRKKTEKNQRPAKIAVFVSDLFDFYQKQMIEGIRYQASLENIKIILINGGPLDSPVAEGKYKNFIYNHISDKIIDGIIFFSGSLINYIGFENYINFIAQFNNFRKISIGIKVPGMPSIVVNNKAGTYKLVTHLIKEHHCKRIVFIKGPEKNEEAEERFNGYCEALTDNHIVIDKKLIYPGEFQKESGVRAIISLLKEKVKFDSIAGVDDYTCIGVYEVLKEKKNEFFKKVKIVGYDDIALCTSITPTLTTVRQPLFEMGETSVQIMKKMLLNKEVDDIYTIPTNIILRESCGCSVNQRFLQLFHNPVQKTGKDLETLINVIYKEISDKFNLTLIKNSTSNFLKNIRSSITLIVKSIIHNTPIAIQKKFPALFNMTMRQGVSPALWTNILLIILDNYIHSGFSTAENQVIHHVWHTFHSVLYQIQVRILTNELVYKDFIDSILERTGDQLINVFNIDAIKRIIIDTFHDNHIKCQISLFKQGSFYRYSEIFLQMFNDRRNVVLFKTNTLSPVNLEEIDSNTLLITILHKDYDPIGFCLFDLSEIDAISCDFLSNKISRSITGAWLMDAVTHHAKILEDEVAKRTEELNNANAKLKEKSFTDSLSGLKNRRFLMEVILPEIENFKRNLLYQKMHDDKRSQGRFNNYVILLLDIDHFKKVNDLYGHINGDIVIRKLSAILKQYVRKNDHIIRFGGEEFMIIFKNFHNDNDNAITKIDEIRAKIQNHQFKLGNDEFIQKTCSIGAMNYPANMEYPDNIHFMETISMVDSALYYAKDSGRNKSVYISVNQSIELDTAQKKLIITDIREARKQNLIECIILPGDVGN
ncbi:MAG: diguanylate cyclase [Spirochaetales bacterium]|nr:diguanylate cyclase [Spirochaetales bacterium]